MRYRSESVLLGSMWSERDVRESRGGVLMSLCRWHNRLVPVFIHVTKRMLLIFTHDKISPNIIVIVMMCQYCHDVQYLLTFLIMKKSVCCCKPNCLIDTVKNSIYWNSTFIRSIFLELLWPCLYRSLKSNCKISKVVSVYVSLSWCLKCIWIMDWNQNVPSSWVLNIALGGTQKSR